MPTQNLRLPMPYPCLPVARPPLPVAYVRAAVLVLLGGACASSADSVANGDDPVAALRSTAASTRYTDGYWLEQGRTDAGGRWTQATAYCGQAQARPGLEAEGARPNCRAVWSANFRLVNERSAQALRERVDARAARERALTPAARARAADSLLIKP
jgi:hypothetical protein